MTWEVIMRSITISVCANCDVDREVHVLDGCNDADYQRVKVCAGCFECPEDCTC